LSRSKDPAFAAVSLIRRPVQRIVPLIIAINLAIALALIFTLARGTAGVAEFGLTVTKFRYVGLAVALCEINQENSTRDN
jgi:hypothetical protein